MLLIRTLDPSDIRRQQSGNEQHPPHLLVGGHALPSSRSLPSHIHSAQGSHGLSVIPQYPSSQYDAVKVEDDYMVSKRVSFDRYGQRSNLIV